MKQLWRPYAYFIAPAAVVGTLAAVQIAIAAWVPPTANPPGNNAAGPINTGSSYQSKSGGIGVGGYTPDANNYISSPSMYVGRINLNGTTRTSWPVDTDTNSYPTSLSVAGGSTKTIQISGVGMSTLTANFTDNDTDTDTRCNAAGYCSQVCIGSDCRSSWPSSTGADGNNYSTGVSVSGGSTKTITINRNGLSPISASFTDSDTDTKCNASGSCSQVCIGGDCRSSWPVGGGTADGNNYPTSVSVSGGSTKTITILRNGLSPITTSFTDDSGSGGGDNLGNHSATQDLYMNSYHIRNANAITASSIGISGIIGINSSGMNMGGRPINSVSNLNTQNLGVSSGMNVYGSGINMNGYNILNVGSLTYSSDERLKKDIATIDGALDKVQQLRGVNFTWADPEKNQKQNIGLIAQEVEAVVPEVVSTNAQGYKGVEYDKLVAVLIEAVKEQQQQIDALRTQVESLTNQQ